MKLSHSYFGLKSKSISTKSFPNKLLLNIYSICANKVLQILRNYITFERQIYLSTCFGQPGALRIRT